MDKSEPKSFWSNIILLFRFIAGIEQKNIYMAGYIRLHISADTLSLYSIIQKGNRFFCEWC